MQIVYSAGMYVAQMTDADDAALLAAAGWRFNKFKAGWCTTAPNAAARFAQFCVGEAAKRVEKFQGNKMTALEASYAVEAELDIPRSQECIDAGLDFRPYQRAGVAFAEGRPQCLIADPPRVGKTMTAIGVMNRAPVAPRTLVICPAIAKVHWCREIAKWSSHGIKPEYAEGAHLPSTQSLVINYDILTRHAEYLHAQPWDIVICDESHALKNGKSQRSTVVLGGTRRRLPGIPFKRRLFLSGTPLFTRPIDLWTTCHALDRNGVGSNWKYFIYKYCDAKSNGFGIDMSGASNLEELQARMRAAFMIRRERAAILNQVPPNRQTVVLPAGGLAKIVAKERNIVRQNLKWFEEALRYGDADTLLAMAEDLDGIDRTVCGDCDGDGRVLDDDTPVPCEACCGSGKTQRVTKDNLVAATAALNQTRQELALAKLPMCGDFITELLETEPKVVIFCHHRAVAHRLKEMFGDMALTIMGGQSTTRRQAIIDQFKDDPSLRVVIANMTAAGVAISLAAANVAVYVETSWIPAEMDQTEDRIWETWKTEAVTIYKLLVEGSIDVEMDYVVTQRQRDITKAMDISAILGTQLSTF